MSEHRAEVSWRREATAPFVDQRYSRVHTWRFDGGAEIEASASPHVVPEPMSSAAGVDPEEAYVAALSSCHMLWFLSVAARAGHVVGSYVDRAVGHLEKNAEGRLAITRVVLDPEIRFEGEPPSADAVRALHHDAHDRCFLASSVRTEVVVAG